MKKIPTVTLFFFLAIPLGFLNPEYVGTGQWWAGVGSGAILMTATFLRTRMHVVIAIIAFVGFIWICRASGILVYPEHAYFYGVPLGFVLGPLATVILLWPRSVAALLIYAKMDGLIRLEQYLTERYPGCDRDKQ